MCTNRLDSCESFSAILYFYCAQGNSSLVIGVYVLHISAAKNTFYSKEVLYCAQSSVSKTLRNFAISYLLYYTQHYLESNSVWLHLYNEVTSCMLEYFLSLWFLGDIASIVHKVLSNQISFRKCFNSLGTAWTGKLISNLVLSIIVVYQFWSCWLSLFIYEIVGKAKFRV